MQLSIPALVIHFSETNAAGHLDEFVPQVRMVKQVLNTANNKAPSFLMENRLVEEHLCPVLLLRPCASDLMDPETGEPYEELK